MNAFDAVPLGALLEAIPLVLWQLALAMSALTLEWFPVRFLIYLLLGVGIFVDLRDKLLPGTDIVRKMLPDES